jgi:hypothetical protein
MRAELSVRWSMPRWQKHKCTTYSIQRNIISSSRFPHPLPSLDIRTVLRKIIWANKPKLLLALLPPSFVPQAVHHDGTLTVSGFGPGPNGLAYSAVDWYRMSPGPQFPVRED